MGGLDQSCTNQAPADRPSTEKGEAGIAYLYVCGAEGFEKGSVYVD